MHSKIILACLVFTLVACDQSSSPSATPSRQEVGVVTLKTQPVTLSSDLSGRTVAAMTSEVRPQVDGIIKKRLFTEGSEVTAGQVLYQIDPASYQAAYDTAKAALQNVQVSVKSAKLKAQRYAALAKEMVCRSKMLMTPKPAISKRWPMWPKKLLRWKRRVSIGLYPSAGTHFRSHRHFLCDTRGAGDG